MPAKTTAKPSAAAIKALRMATAMTALASDLPKPPKQPPREQPIINRVRVLNDVTLTPGRKLLKAALKAQRLSIHIGFAPNHLHIGEGSPTEGESDTHPLSPRYYYYGRVQKLSPALLTTTSCSCVPRPFPMATGVLTFLPTRTHTTP